MVLGELAETGGNDDAELAEPPCIKNVGYELMQSCKREGAERGQAKSAISFYGSFRWNQSPSGFSNHPEESRPFPTHILFYRTLFEIAATVRPSALFMVYCILMMQTVRLQLRPARGPHREQYKSGIPTLRSPIRTKST